MTSNTSPHAWKFFRTGGLDQVSLETAADLLALHELDQKLWVALSCPVKGLQLDERTLALMDTDGDGRIGVPEVLAAVKWAAERLADPGDLLRGREALPLASLNDQTADGRLLRASAQRILAAGGRADAAAITVAEVSASAAVLAANPLTGDGIIVPEASSEPAVQQLIRDMVDCGVGTARASGAKGVTAADVAAFFTAAEAYVAWTSRSAASDIAVLGAETDAACHALRAVRAKVEDFFARCRLASFDARALAALNRSEADYAAIAGHELERSAAEVRGFPLARIEPGRALPLVEGVNPAWADRLAALRQQVVAPLLGADRTSLTAAEWAGLTERFAAYETWYAGKAGSTVEKLGAARLQEMLRGPGRAALEALLARDRELAPEFKAITEVERLARYHRDLRTLLHNFVNFADFYSRDRWAAFQAGTLYLDSRATELCVRVDGPNPLAAMSKAYIAYCACTPAGGGTPMTIAACFTQGDSDYLFVGRNGVFYDRQGKLWYAVITSIVDNPISIRQAFWSPYKKFLRFIEEQIAKRAAAADTAASARLATTAEKTVHADQAKPEPKKFDLALITGIGVAIGSIGTFCAAVFAKFVDLPSWQLPLIIVGLMLVISLPSMFIAALKLRQRTLGPLLESTGWAINGRVKINIPFGAALTEMASLPPGARRSLEDPYEDKSAARAKRRIGALVTLLVLLGTAIWIRWDHNQRGHYFWQPAPTSPAPATPAAAPAAPSVAPAPQK
jgi:hypothetical protein